MNNHNVLTLVQISFKGKALTERQVEILYLVSGGYSNIEISEKLWLSSKTVETHVGNLKRLFNSGDRKLAERKFVLIAKDMIEGCKEYLRNEQRKRSNNFYYSYFYEHDENSIGELA